MEREALLQGCSNKQGFHCQPTYALTLWITVGTGLLLVACVVPAWMTGLYSEVPVHRGSSEQRSGMWGSDVRQTHPSTLAPLSW